jgi:hypothetical protein
MDYVENLLQCPVLEHPHNPVARKHVGITDARKGNIEFTE